jgi:hypothetical protein
MRRKIWIALLALGAVSGFALGFAQLHHYRHHGYGCGPGAWGHERRAAFEQHVAELCTQAAGKVFESNNKAGAAP